MDTREILTFVTVCDTLNYQKAAERLQYTPSTLFKHVRQLEAERDMLRAVGGEAFADVKPKFREQVYALLDVGSKARPVEEQLEAIREKYEEYFIDGDRPQRLPRFGGPTRGSMPRGAVGAVEQFSQAWGFGNRR